MPVRNYQEALSCVTQVLAEDFEVPPREIVEDAHLFDDLELDSLDLLEAVALLEKRLGITLLDEDVLHMTVVRGAANVVLDRSGAG